MTNIILPQLSFEEYVKKFSSSNTFNLRKEEVDYCKTYLKSAFGDSISFYQTKNFLGFVISEIPFYVCAYCDDCRPVVDEPDNVMISLMGSTRHPYKELCQSYGDYRIDLSKFIYKNLWMLKPESSYYDFLLSEISELRF